MTIRVLFSPEFKRNVKKLIKRYPDILQDFEPLLRELESGQTPGDCYPGLPQIV